MTDRHDTRVPAADAPTTELPTAEMPTELTPAVVDEQPSSSSRLISATALMATGTALSRILGFFRVALISFVLGNATRQVEMFNLANTIPNMIYILLAGGALNTVLVPQIVRAIKHDKDGGEAYTNRILTAGFLIMAAITAAATLLAPAIMWLYTSAGWKEPAMAGQFDSVVMLAYLCLPQIFFYGAHVLIGQVLNARDKFGPMMFAPIANNIVSILVFGLYLILWGQGDGDSAFTTRQELVLGLGSTLGIAIQAAVLVPFLRSAGFRYRPRFDLKGTGLGHTFSLAKWTLGFVVATQIAVVVVTRLASSATTGAGPGAGWTVYNNAYLLWILPHSLITVSLATAMLPQASRLAAEGDLAGVTEETQRTMRLALTVVLPAAVAFLALAHPLAMVLFGNGRGAVDAPLIGWTLMAFAVGLVPFTLHYICLRAFYALEDTRSTFFLQCMVSAANIVLAIAFVIPVDRPTWVAPGLAIAYALAYVLGLGIAFRWLGRKIPDLALRPIIRHCVRLFLAVLPAGIAAAAISWAFSLISDSQLIRVAGLAVAGLVALGLFFGLARVFHIAEVNQIMRTMLRRGGRGDDPGPSDEPEPPSSSTSQGESAGQGPNPGDSGDSNGAMLSPSHTIKSGARPDHVSDADNVSDTVGDVSTMTPSTMSTAGPGMTDGTEDASDRTQEADTGESRPASSVTGPDDTDPRLAPVPGDPDATDPHGQSAVLPQLEAGTMLGGRYRLEEILAERQQTVTWRAIDQVLSRSVLIHLLAPGDERAPELLSVARRAAVATDSRFLRVLDAVPSDGPDHGSYIVCEYAVGQTLEIVLSSGPLSGLEAAWLVREVADALSGVHAQGLFHERISPNTVVITPTGNVKIVGLLIEAALLPRPDLTLQGEDSPERTDVLDLGRLLYATLVCRWPGGPAYGLADAPASGPRWMTPRQVRAGVSPALDTVCDQILGDPPRHRAPLITTANDAVNALTKVLGAADATSDLERRLRQPVPVVGAHDPHEPVTEEMSITDLPAGGASTMRHSDSGVTRTVAASSGPASQGTPSPRSGASASGPSSATEPTTITAAPPSDPDSTVEEEPRRRRRWPVVLLTLLVLAAIVTLVVFFVVNPMLRNQGGEDPTTAPTAPATPQQVKIDSAEDFDPQQTGNDPKSENPERVPLAIDGDPETRWQTLTYQGDPKFGNLKDGLGLVIDLGEARNVSSVHLLLSGDGTSVEARVPKADTETRTSAPMSSADRWRVVSEQEDAADTAELKFDEPVKTRFVLVYLTSLPREGSGYRGGIYEVEVNG